MNRYSAQSEIVAVLGEKIPVNIFYNDLNTFLKKIKMRGLAMWYIFNNYNVYLS